MLESDQDQDGRRTRAQTQPEAAASIASGEPATSMVAVEPDAGFWDRF
jgi:hypothetical protein